MQKGLKSKKYRLFHIKKILRNFLLCEIIQLQRHLLTHVSRDPEPCQHFSLILRLVSLTDARWLLQ